MSFRIKYPKDRERMNEKNERREVTERGELRKRWKRKG